MDTTKIKTLLLQAEKALILNQYSHAKKILLSVIELDDKNPEAYYLLGEVYCKTNWFKESVQCLEKANRLLPNNPRIFHLLGWAVFMNGDTKQGRQLLLKALKTLSEDISILCDLAVLENQQFNYEMAEKYALCALEIDPNHPQAQEVFQATQMFKRLSSLRKREAN